MHNRNTKYCFLRWFATELSVALSDFFCNGHRSNKNVLPNCPISVFSVDSVLIPLNIYMCTCVCRCISPLEVKAVPENKQLQYVHGLQSVFILQQLLQCGNRYCKAKSGCLPFQWKYVQFRNAFYWPTSFQILRWKGMCIAVQYLW